MIKSLLLCLGLMTLASAAHTQCRQALALGLDVSGSVDAREYRQQLDGLAQALNSEQVRANILSQPHVPVMLLVYEWSGPQDQHLLIPWTAVTSAGELARIVDTLTSTDRRAAAPGTALGVAMQVGVAHLARTECWAKTLDISGDGKSNLGIRPRDARPVFDGQDVTINALVIGADAPSIGDTRQTELGELSAYFAAEVIYGDDAFVETSIGFDDYADAMTRKLLRELAELQISLR